MAEKTTQFDGQLEKLVRDAERIQERIGLLQRLRELDLEEAGVVTTVTTAPVATQAPAQTQEAPKKRGRPKTVKTEATTGEGKSVDLPTLLETIGQNVSRPLTQAEFVTLCRESGYTTKAKDFSNMVYQALLKLVKKGKFKKNDETRQYEYVRAAA